MEVAETGTGQNENILDKKDQKTGRTNRNAYEIRKSTFSYRYKNRINISKNRRIEKKSC